MRFPHGETVTIVRESPGGTDAYGDPTTSTSARTDIPLCGVAPRMSSEPTERGRQGVIVGWSVYLPAGVDVRSTDQMELPGVTMLNAEGEVVPAPCDIEGIPADWVNPFTGWTPGAEVAVRRAAG